MEGTTAEALITTEAHYLQAIVDAVSSGDPEYTRDTVQHLMQLAPEAIATMRNTPIGETPHIHVANVQKTSPD